jgi:hypothetical protein
VLRAATAGTRRGEQIWFVHQRGQRLWRPQKAGHPSPVHPLAVPKYSFHASNNSR